MDISSNALQGMNAASAAAQQSAPPPQPDGRATADAAAIAKDPAPEVPLPMPAQASQTGLVSKAAISETENAPKLDATGVSAAERLLKPYGINMLPEKHDAPKQEAPPED